MADLVSTEAVKIPEIVDHVRKSFQNYKTSSIIYRMKQLNAVKKLLEENKTSILDAFYKDLHKSSSDNLSMEYTDVLTELNLTLDNLKKWAGKQLPPEDILNKFKSMYVKPEPYGVVLVFFPWNYPFQTIFLPLIGAIAAGNCCVMKPSEKSVASSNLITQLVTTYLDQDCYIVVPGSADVGKALLKEKFDYIFYTGSSSVGKIVMQNAAENLTPVSLEIRGKSPVLVACDANLGLAARRIIWAKCLNAGQTCIAPDYVLYAGDNREELVAEMKKALEDFYGENPLESENYGRIINEENFKKLSRVLGSTEGKIVAGGQMDMNTSYIAPTIVVDVTEDDKLMQEEIMGPILPIISVDNMDEAVLLINKREKPLALYVFTNNPRKFQKIVDRTSSGGVLCNDTLMQDSYSGFPFGCVGHSAIGMGVYHGKHTFDTFSHYKPIMETGCGMKFSNKMPDSNGGQQSWIVSPKTKAGLPQGLIFLLMVLAVVAMLLQIYGIPHWLYRIIKYIR